MQIWFWQQAVSPHMIELAEALSRHGHNVTVVAETMLTPERLKEGWSLPTIKGTELRLVNSDAQVRAIIQILEKDSLHFCSGIRDNGLVGTAQRLLADRSLAQWVVMETVDDSGWIGKVKRRIYRSRFRRWRDMIQGVLAIGHSTPDWLNDLGVLPAKVFPFAYFLPEPRVKPGGDEELEKFRFLYVGRLIELKQVDLLIDALAMLRPIDFELAVVGSGPLEGELRERARRSLGDRVDWIGRLEMRDVQTEMTRADCLVLPSRYDGWGAVAVEALMVGTPVICSDTCGVAGVARASGAGAVFPHYDAAALRELLKAAMDQPRLSKDRRAQLADWATCLNGDSGARYLTAIVDHQLNGSLRPEPPWVSAGT